MIRHVLIALRSLCRQPAFSLSVILVLALGFGLTLTVFTVVDGVLLRALPYFEAGRLVTLTFGGNTVPLAVYDAWRRQSGAFEDLSVSMSDSPVLTGLGEPEHVTLWSIGANTFSLLGIHPALGRPFAREDDLPGGPPVVILNDEFWRSRFGARPDALGRLVVLDGVAHQIVGVMPRGVVPTPASLQGGRSLPAAMDLWRNLGAAVSGVNGRERAADWSFRVLGRLKADVRPQQALEQLQVVSPYLWQTIPRSNGFEPDLAFVSDEIAGDVRRPLLLLTTAVALVLLIACVNAANLLTARTLSQRRELATRMALGASFRNIFSQLLTESVLIALSGALIGLAAAVWIVSVLVAMVGADLPRVSEIAVDGRIVTAAIAFSILTGVLLAVPRGFAARRWNNLTLKEGSGGSGISPWRSRVSDAFVLFQVGATVVLLVGAGLLGRSYMKVTDVDPGFQPSRVTVAHLWLQNPPYAGRVQIAEFGNRVVEGLRALPGITAAVSTGIPFSPGGRTAVAIPGAADRNGDPRSAYLTATTPDYFRALGIQLVQGREFRSEGAEDSDAIIVDQTFVREHLSGRQPVGQRIVFRGQTVTIVGVVSSVRQVSLSLSPKPQIYQPFSRGAFAIVKVVVRTSGDLAAVAPSLRAVIAAADPNLPIDKLNTFESMLSASVARQRVLGLLLWFFAAAGVTLAAASVYGLVAYAVSGRTREIGIRVALGAEPRHIILMTARRGGLLVLAGLALGIVGAAGVSRLLSGFLYEVSHRDPFVFAAAAGLVVAVAVVACAVPVRRALRLDPTRALRTE